MSQIEILQRLIRCQSVTPKDDGAMNLVKTILEGIGFSVKIVHFGESDDRVLNLYAKFGSGSKNVCFAGHVDVVPAGDGWSHDPFSGHIENGKLYGRGAVDMKGAIASAIYAVDSFIKKGIKKDITISFLLTGDEEGIAINGTKKMLDWLLKQNEKIDICILGEPTSHIALCDTIKVGARGSITFDLVVHGKQGHVAYEHLNPIDIMAQIALELTNYKFNDGDALFQDSNLEFTSLISDSKAENLVPNIAKARFNVRFPISRTANDIAELITNTCKKCYSNIDIKWHSSGGAFLAQHANISKIASNAIESIMGFKPQINTFGGTSDARFIIKNCQEVIELGLFTKMAHRVDEYAELMDIEKLSNIYLKILELI
ncbi:Succinyl-diaminopimelate desuccinylase [Candidatus Cyrtobacter comes]|uniref:Succinyl-diaminopimelate desuccinylase n=1 Tax=Candidatus Cyrtobacter comes TaxID=675776 RepID=A0ABU5L8B7_9RICK|nr:succinyl-diaminopimelate desuccinylase [Candidatus Cyrtobacter comes]MDZ5762292.1 Succinyl-diaminopimelate desuccinylase [Candidatus Cyrtobacter comes]